VTSSANMMNSVTITVNFFILSSFQKTMSVNPA
jgi:hypothetical protein